MAGIVTAEKQIQWNHSDHNHEQHGSQEDQQQSSNSRKADHTVEPQPSAVVASMLDTCPTVNHS